MKTLGKEKNLVVNKPDKGIGVVILNRNDYVSKMQDILRDHTKFEKCAHADVSQLTLKMEDKVNRLLRKLMKEKVLSERCYKDLYAKGTSPAVLYGLPKIHKTGIPLRPVMAAYGTCSYKIAKFIVPILAPFTTNEYTIRNSYDFFSFLRNTNVPENAYMASFDITSLFTNIPLEETINIAIDNLYANDNDFNGMSKRDFKQLLSLSVKENYFLFDSNLYKQTDGCAMGSPISGTLANLFLCFHERHWIANCPQEFKPLIYKRYVDDTFTVFRDASHAPKFLRYINEQHSNMLFTMEGENESKLPFLDLMIERSQHNFSVGIYRKPTFSGLGTSFFSFCDYKFKINAIKTLLFRAFHLTSSYLAFDSEVTTLRKFFLSNGYTKHIFENQVFKFLNNFYQPSNQIPTANKEVMYISLPYLGETSNKIECALQKSFKNFLPHINFRFIHNNTFKIKSFFNFKDKLPLTIRASTVYEYKCPNCQLGYIGSSTRTLKERVDSHFGRSSRTGRPLNKPSPSAIREHAEICKCILSFKDFRILDTTNNESDLRILESIYIDKFRPKLNRESSAVPLNILHK